jgi:hypothetical protein
MNAEALRQLSEPALAEYMWRRFRLEPPLDPPLDVVFRDEPPEAFLIDALPAAEESFRLRLAQAVKRNLTRLASEASRGDLNPTSTVQLASLAFLSTELQIRSIVHPLYELALAWIFNHPAPGSHTEDALYQILVALASLQESPFYVPFWMQLWREVRSGRLKAVAVYGLSRADANRAIELLPEIASERTIDLPWSFGI